jgi:isocitrate lyase
MKRLGIQGIYLGGWATSAKGSLREDPGPDLASYPLRQVPDEAAPLTGWHSTDSFARPNPVH